ncbi:hypothetical protein PMSM_03975 [Paenibacillus macquariensis subsp. macquariensis]|nr:hypothetical protein PMSM_03975 [Paenibacillus macquariensis subsp. macquariensis]
MTCAQLQYFYKYHNKLLKFFSFKYKDSFIVSFINPFEDTPTNKCHDEHSIIKRGITGEFMEILSKYNKLTKGMK